jgi:hypothetical protein
LALTAASELGGSNFFKLARLSRNNSLLIGAYLIVQRWCPILPPSAIGNPPGMENGEMTTPLPARSFHVLVGLCLSFG